MKKYFLSIGLLVSVFVLGLIFGSQGHSRARAGNTGNVPRWTYLFEDNCNKELIERRGAEGWELASCYIDPKDDFSHLHCIFKKSDR